MRRFTSVALLVLGGWLLSSEAMVAWMDMGMGIGAQMIALAIVLLFAAPLLALGTWASPGNRPADLGLTLMIVAGVVAFSAIAVFMTLKDPAVRKMMPPDQPMPDIAISPVIGAINLLLIAASGYALWRQGQTHLRGNQTPLEESAGDR